MGNMGASYEKTGYKRSTCTNAKNTSLFRGAQIHIQTCVVWFCCFCVEPIKEVLEDGFAKLSWAKTAIHGIEDSIGKILCSVSYAGLRRRGSAG